MDPNLTQKYLDIAGIILVSLDRRGTITMINRPGSEILGYEPQELLGKNWFDTCLPQEIRDKVKVTFEKLLQGDVRPVEYYENSVRMKTGDEKIIAWKNTLLTDENGHITGTLSSGLDVTEHRRVEKALESSEARIAALTENAVEAIITVNKQGTIESFNPAAEKLFGYKKKDVIGKSFDVLVFKNSDTSHIKKLLNEKSKGDSRLGHEIVGKRKDGNPFSAHVSLNEFSFEGKKLFTGIVHDISEHRRTEKALEESEARLRALVETAVDGIITINEQGIIESFNPASERLFGYSADEVIGKNVKILMPSPHYEKHDEYIQAYLTSGEKKIIGIGREVMGHKKDGTEFPMHLSVSEIILDKRRIFTGIVRDLTTQKVLQQQILQSERLAVIGQMAAKVAHEIRNPLSSISLNAELLEEEIDSLSCENTDEARSLLQSMSREIDRVTSLTDEYLQFSRLPQSQPVKGDLNDLIREFLELLSEEVKQKKIKVASQDINRKLDCPFDRAQLRRVLVNIARNAIEAMPRGGTFTISTEKKERQAVIRIRDTGIGIPSEMREDIFNPFFTTKEFGTGLGLAISQQIILEHGGRIYCESQPGKGSTFTIELPLQNKS